MIGQLQLTSVITKLYVLQCHFFIPLRYKSRNLAFIPTLASKPHSNSKPVRRTEQLPVAVRIVKAEIPADDVGLNARAE